MAHNKSRRKIREELLGSKLATWRAWTVYGVCYQDTRGAVTVEHLLAQPDPPESLSELIICLRCQCCGGRARDVSLRLRESRDDRWVHVTGWRTG